MSEKVADEAVEALGFAHRRAAKLVARGLVAAIAVAPEARQRPDDRGERRAQVVASPRSAWPSAAFALGAEPRLVDVAPPSVTALDGDGGLVAHGVEQAPLGGRRARMALPVGQHADRRRSAERLVRIGTNSQRRAGQRYRCRVPVRPLGSHDQRAAARSASLSARCRAESAARAVELAVPTDSSPASDRSPRFSSRARWVTDGPQQVVEVDDARRSCG